MKSVDTIINSSLPLPINSKFKVSLPSPLPKVLFVSGKGGVGKTLFTQSLGAFLRKEYPNLNIILSNLEDSFFSPLLSVQEYLKLRLHSDKIAQWITESSFFNSIYQMTPGLQTVCCMGHLYFQATHALGPTIYLIDSPSSGHLLSLFESIRIFTEIFQKGILFDDLIKMKNFFWNSNETQIFLLCGPHPIIYTETQELMASLTQEQGLNSAAIFWYWNQFLTPHFSELEESEKKLLPPLLQQQLETEYKMLEKKSLLLKRTIPLFFSSNPDTLIEDFSSCFTL